MLYLFRHHIAPGLHPHSAHQCEPFIRGSCPKGRYRVLSATNQSNSRCIYIFVAYKIIHCLAQSPGPLGIASPGQFLVKERFESENSRIVKVRSGIIRAEGCKSVSACNQFFKLPLSGRFTPRSRPVYAVARELVSVGPEDLGICCYRLVAVPVEPEEYRGLVLGIWRIEEQRKVSVALFVVQDSYLFAGRGSAKGLLVHA